MKRGDVFDARLDPVEGSEQGGTRPVVVVSRDAINTHSPVVLAIPCTTYRENRRVYPTQVLVVSPEGGLSQDKDRLLKFRGRLTDGSIELLNQALIISLDLPS
jgi:mRNA interferase MazF